MKKIFMMLAAISLLNGCVVMSGNYEVIAYDESGQVIKGPRMMASGRGIYTAKIALCQVHPRASLKVMNTDTGEELKSESKRCS